MKEKEIITKLINALSEIDGVDAVIAYNDFTEDRQPYMIVIGVESTEQMNFALPDYKYKLNVIIDTFVDEDKDGEVFNGICREVRRRLDKIVNREESLQSLFEEIPVVGFFFSGESFSISDKSNRCSLTYEAVASF